MLTAKPNNVCKENDILTKLASYLEFMIDLTLENSVIVR